MKGFPLLRRTCLLALLTVSSSVLALEQVPALDLDQLQPTRDQVVASQNTVELLRRHHYNRTRLDDALSAQMYDTYLKHLDPQRSLFTQQDIDAFSGNRLRLDDLLLQGDLRGEGGPDPGIRRQDVPSSASASSTRSATG